MSFRSQNNANKEAAYQKVLDDYTDAFRMLVDKPELAKLQSEMARAALPGSNTASLSPEDMTVRNYLMLLYGLFERTHLLYRKKWIDQETWNQWSTFLEVVAKHPPVQRCSSDRGRNVRQALHGLRLKHSKRKELKLEAKSRFL